MPQASAFTFSPQEYPDSPGCYLMKDGSGRIIYVGKANSLRNRVGSYFRSPEHLPAKTRVMMGRVAGIDILCTHSEKEALLLEASLIKKHRPRYNIVLRDDKSYILFRLDAQATYPRLSLTRKVTKNGDMYFGPFTSAQAARQTLKVVNRIFPLRKCKDTTFRNRTRPCLQHHLGRCLAPCVYDVDPAEYAQMVKNLRLFLSGRSRDLVSRLQREMHQASAELAFEKAASIRDQVRAIEQTVEQQTVVLPHEEDCDVLALAETDRELVVGMSFIRQGKLLDHKTFFWTNEQADDLQVEQDERVSKDLEGGLKPDQDCVEPHMSGGEDVLRTVLLQFYTPEKFIPQRIILPFQLSDPDVENILSERRGAPVHLVPAWRQQDKNLIDFARTNALQARSDDSEQQLLRNLSRKLGARGLERIEGVDVSHLGGQGVVVGQVVAERGRLEPEEYRQYTFPDLEGSRDDYAALAAWVERRIRSGPPWPDLVLIDGGKGQLSAVHRTLEQAWSTQGMPPEDRQGSWALAALAKGARRQGELEERVFVPERKNPISLRPGSKELLLLQQIRDAAHRFVLSRQKRSRTRRVLDSRLEKLPGVGPRTARLLWDRFGSVQAMLQADPAQFESIPGIGPHKAKKLHAALHSHEKLGSST
ncbi:excinuclease ABC subunit UvrC [Desulfovermiculus halophilus]|uniref:excinuclease ABC subunit UvrC n=1 Tax=Desulfovermiculus halophilus TaxID=339722 RepID=UPI0005510174|nr:excinuclease ABC subunit UvrC [Desulfovermiculus halophilus]